MFLRSAHFCFQLKKKERVFFFPISEQMFLILIRDDEDEGCQSLPWHSILARTTTLQTWLGCRKLLSNLEIWWIWWGFELLAQFEEVRLLSSVRLVQRCPTPLLCTATHTHFLLFFLSRKWTLSNAQVPLRCSASGLNRVPKFQNQSLSLFER